MADTLAASFQSFSPYCHPRATAYHIQEIPPRDEVECLAKEIAQQFHVLPATEVADVDMFRQYTFEFFELLRSVAGNDRELIAKLEMEAIIVDFYDGHTNVCNAVAARVFDVLAQFTPKEQPAA
jgi:hypothetical protein